MQFLFHYDVIFLATIILCCCPVVSVLVMLRGGRLQTNIEYPYLSFINSDIVLLISWAIWDFCSCACTIIYQMKPISLPWHHFSWTMEKHSHWSHIFIARCNIKARALFSVSVSKGSMSDSFVLSHFQSMLEIQSCLRKSFGVDFQMTNDIILSACRDKWFKYNLKPA